MKFTCPHCQQSCESGPEEAAGLQCPRCGEFVSSDNVASDPEDDPVDETQHPAQGNPTGTSQSRIAAFRGLNRNVRILGGTAILLLGGLAIFLAIRGGGNTLNDIRKIHNQTIQNEYFKGLLASGSAGANELAAVEGLRPYGAGFIGMSREKLPWAEALAFADRTGGEVLDVAVTAQKSRKEFTGWLADSYPNQHGRTLWVRENMAAKLMDSPDVFEAASRTQPRQVYLHWPRTEGWKNQGWSWTIPPQFDEVQPFSKWGLALVRLGKVWGLINEAGKMVQAPLFDQVETFSEYGSARVKKEGKWGLLDRAGKQVAQTEWEEVQDLIHGFLPVRRDGKWGYLDAAGKLVVPCVWDDAWRFSAEGFAVVTREGKRGFIDRTGKVIVEPVWDGALNFSKQGLGLVRRGMSWGLMDSTGKLLSEPVWNSPKSKNFWRTSRRFDLGFLWATNTDNTSPLFGSSALLGLDGKVIQDSAFKGRSFLTEDGHRFYADSGEGGRLGAEGKPLFKVPGTLGEFSEGLAIVTSDQQAGVVDGKGNWIAPMQPGTLSAFKGGFAMGEFGGKWGFMDRTGKFVVKQEWDGARDFSEGRAAVKRGDKWGFVDETGKIVAEPEWREVGQFSEGFAAVKPVAAQNPYLKWQFIDRSGKSAFASKSWRPLTSPAKAPEFRNGYFMADGINYYNVLYVDIQGRETQMSRGAKPLSTGLAVKGRERVGWYVNRYNENFYLDSMLTNQDGAVVLPNVQLGADLLADFIPYAEPPKYGFMDKTGKILIQPTWDGARILSANLVWFGTRGKCGLADKTGKILIQPLWDALEVLAVDSGSLGGDGTRLLIGRGGEEILSPWVRVKDGEKVKILQLNGKEAVPASLGATYVDFYGPLQVVIKQPSGEKGEVWSLYEPATGKQVKFPTARTFRWNWNTADAGVLWMLDQGTAEWRLMSQQAQYLGHAQPEIQKPDGWGLLDGRGLLEKPDGKTFIDKSGTVFSEKRWEEARDFSEGRAAVRWEGKWGFIGTDGKLIAVTEWDEVQDFSRGMAAVRRTDRWGYIDLTGTLVIEPVWDSAGSFTGWSGGSVMPAGQTGLVPELDVARVTIHTAIGIIDRSGVLIADPKYDSVEFEGDKFVGQFDEGIATRSGQLKEDCYQILKGSDGTIAGKLVWSRSFRTGTSTIGRAKVTLDRAWEGPPDEGWRESAMATWALTDETGKVLSKPEWKLPSRSPKPDGFAPARILAKAPDGKYGLLRRDGSVVVPAQFDGIGWISPGVAAVWSRTEGGLMDAAGTWIFRDNAKVRVARPIKDTKYDNGFRSGLAVIEDTPKWGFARLNR